MEQTSRWLDPHFGGAGQNDWHDKQSVAAIFQRQIDAWRVRPRSAEHWGPLFPLAKDFFGTCDFTLQARFVDDLRTSTESLARAWKASDKSHYPFSLLPEFNVIEVEFFYTALRLLRKIYEPGTQLTVNPTTGEAVWRRICNVSGRVDRYALASPPNGDAAVYVDEFRHDLSHLQTLMDRHRVMLRESKPYETPWDDPINDLICCLF